MKEFFKPIRSDSIIYQTFIISSVVILITFIYVLFRFFSLPPFVPVFNQMPWGNDRIGPKLTIFIPILVAILISVINLIISSLMYSKKPLLSRIFSVTNLLVTFLILIFNVVIISLII